MKTIVITSIHVFISRNILCAPIFDLLNRGGYRIIIVVPNSKAEYFKSQFKGENLHIYSFTNPLTRLDDLFKDLSIAALRTKALSVMRKRKMGIERPWSQKLFFWAPLIKKIIPKLYSLIIPLAAFDDLFDKYSPNLIFSTDVLSAIDSRIMTEARKRKIKILGMVRSWDNLTTKSGFRVIPDQLVVHNEILKKEAMDIHDINESIIKVVGVPHYDNYVKGERSSREDLLKKLGIKGKYFLFGPLGDRIIKVGNRIHKHTLDRDFIELIAKNLPENISLLVRLPPTDTVNMEGYKDNKKVIFDQPGYKFFNKTIKYSELSKNDDNHLINSIYYSRLSRIINDICLCLELKD